MELQRMRRAIREVVKEGELRAWRVIVSTPCERKVSYSTESMAEGYMRNHVLAG